MKVQDLMTSPARSCTPDTSLATAARLMGDYGCGALPVLDDAGRPVGILTDRDVCMAVARMNRFPSAIAVREAMTSNPSTCAPGSEIGDVLNLMATRRVRRLPVVDGEGRLVGILSQSDVISSVQDAQNFDSPVLRRLVAESRRASEPIPRQGLPFPAPF
jgi:CBS domain-containing protein